MKISQEYVFVAWEEEELGIFLTRRHFEILINFYFAIERAHSWGDFWTICNADTRAFCSPFMQCDKHNPIKNELLADISGDVFILNDQEFPLTQCAEETTNIFGNSVLSDYRAGSIRTEYGERINLYSIEKIERMIRDAKNLGIEVEIVTDPFPCNLNDYG